MRNGPLFMPSSHLGVPQCSASGSMQKCKIKRKYNFLLLTKDVLNVKQFHINPFGRTQSVIHEMKNVRANAATSVSAFHFNSVCASLLFYLFQNEIITIICYTNSRSNLNAHEWKWL